MSQEFKKDKIFVEDLRKIRLVVQQGVHDIWNPKLKISVLKQEDEQIILVEKKDKKVVEED